MRILVTGSRDWSDWNAINNALNEYAGNENLTIVHGDCPTGADAMAQKWCDYQLGGYSQRYPADWSRGRRAGPERNAHMVSLGADACLAFIGDCSSPRCHRDARHPSHGASGCADLAEVAGIPTRRIYPKDRP